MPSDYLLCLSLKSSPQLSHITIDDHCSHSTESLAERIQDYAKLLAPKSSTTTIYIDHLPFDDTDHGYKAMIFSKEKLGDRKMLLEGEYKFSSCKSEAKRKALESLLKKTSSKVKEEIEKPKPSTSGRWVFLSD